MYKHIGICEIDPDINYTGVDNAMKCNQYYDINNLNMNYTNDNKLSLFLLNIRSLPDHFRETLVDKITKSLDSGDIVIGVFLDKKRLIL